MGMMASVSPGIRANRRRKIPRKSKVSHDDLSVVGTVLIRFTDWDGTNPGMKYRKTDLPAPDNKQTLFYQHLNLLHDLAWCFPDPEVPLFSGFMANAHNGFASAIDQKQVMRWVQPHSYFYRFLTLTQQTTLDLTEYIKRSQDVLTSSSEVPTSFDVTNAIASCATADWALSEMDSSSITMPDVMSSEDVFTEVQQLLSSMTDGTLKCEDLSYSPSLTGIQSKLTARKK